MLSRQIAKLNEFLSTQINEDSHCRSWQSLNFLRVSLWVNKWACSLYTWCASACPWFLHCCYLPNHWSLHPRWSDSCLSCLLPSIASLLLLFLYIFHCQQDQQHETWPSWWSAPETWGSEWSWWWQWKQHETWNSLCSCGWMLSSCFCCLFLSISSHPICLSLSPLCMGLRKHLFLSLLWFESSYCCYCPTNQWYIHCKFLNRNTWHQILYLDNYHQT